MSARDLSTATLAALRTGEGWAARLDLAFERRAHGCVLAHVRHDGPLTVQRALHPEGPDACHVVIVHPPGGVAAGDTLDIDVDVRARAHAVLAMPGAAKFYRCATAPSRQRIALRVAEGAIVEWLPPETIVFDGARASATLDLDLAHDAVAIGWDIVALGRRARGEAFAQGRWRQRLNIRRGGVPVVDDTLDLRGDDNWLRSRVGLRGHRVVATMFAAGSGIDEALLASCRDAAGESPRIGLTMPVRGLMMIRCLADEAEQARDAFIAIWRRLRPALTGLDPQPLRLWAT
ncbi:MAG TPA: urease accessory protein UreD [Casimicrobiaceae bacterium]|jgi:urease accessory protein